MKQTADWPKEIRLVTWSEVGVASNRGWVDLLAADTGCRVEIAVEPDLVKRFDAVRRGDADLVAGFANETSLMLSADKGFAATEPFAPGIVWAYSRSNSGFLVGNGSNIERPQDIRPGTKIVDVSSFLGVRVYEALLAWAGVTRDDIDWVPVTSTKEVVAAIGEGRAEIAFAIPTSPTARAAEATPTGIHWLDLNSEADPEGAARFQAVYPLVHFGVISQDAVPSARGRWGTESINFLIARADTDETFVRRLATWFQFAQPRFTSTHPDNRFRTREILLDGLRHSFIPVHQGLVTCLDSLGLWTAADEARQAANIELAARYRRAFNQALAQAEEEHISIAADNSAWLELWQQYQHELPQIRVFADLPPD